MKINVVRAEYDEYNQGDGAEEVPHMDPRVVYKAFTAEDGLKAGEYVADVLDNFEVQNIRVLTLDTDGKNVAELMFKLADNQGGIFDGEVIP